MSERKRRDSPHRVNGLPESSSLAKDEAKRTEKIYLQRLLPLELNSCYSNGSEDWRREISRAEKE